MGGRKSPVRIHLTLPERLELEAILRRTTASAGLAHRARILLLLAEGHSITAPARPVQDQRRIVRKGGQRYPQHRLQGLVDAPRSGRPLVFPRAVALHTVKIACELPDRLGCSLSQGDGAEIARQVVASGVVDSISVETVRRMLAHHRLKPGRQQAWLSPQVPRDEAFCHAVQTVGDRYTRPLMPHEGVLCVDEKTSLQPRPRRAPTLPASPDQPVRVEQEYRRQGALNLFAALDTRTGQVYGPCHERKRQVEFIEFLELLDQQIPAPIRLLHVVLANLRMPKGQQVQAWLATHPRFRCYHPPVHGSWMNPVEQGFRIRPRKRLPMANFASKADLRDKLMAFITEYNQHAHPFKWTPQSVAKVIAKIEPSSFARAA